MLSSLSVAARELSLAVCGKIALLGTLALAAQSAFAAYEVVTVTGGGTIDGIVTLAGAPPAGATLKVTKNQDYCGASIPDPTYTVGSGGGLGNVIVYLKNITQGKAPPTEPVALVDDHCMTS